MSTAVRAYKTKELLERVEGLKSFTHIPKGYWIIGVRSNEDLYNKYDDKFYLFKGRDFVMVLSGTTNSGGYGLKNFAKWNKLGTAVIKSDEIYYDVYQKSDGVNIRHHNGKMQCLRQVGPMLHYRDKNKDNKIDESGKLYDGVIGANFHTNSYTKFTGVLSWVINGWSTACQVSNNLTRYWELIGILPKNKKITYCLLKEF